MGKSTKTQRLREKAQAEVKHSKQTFLGSQSEHAEGSAVKDFMPPQNKKIEITELSTLICEDQLIFKVGFRLLPSRRAFSRLTAELFFDGQKIDSLSLRVLQGPLAMDESEFSSVLVLTVVSEGLHQLKVEMYELWSSGEKLVCTSKEATINYVPVKKEDRAVHVRIIKSTAGANLTVASDAQEILYRQINEEIRREAHSGRDKW